MPKCLNIGKLKYDLLEQMLKKYTGAKDRRVVIGPKIGEDAAVIDFGKKYLVTATDPITLTSDRIGWYAVHVNANDVAVRGARPRWFQSVILLPHNSSEELAERIFSDISNACQLLDIAVIGGHTETTYGLERPIVIGQMTGEVAKHKLITTSGARPGDQIILTKGIVIEGTAIIATEKEKELIEVYSADFIKSCQDYLYNPGISVVEDVLLANDVATVHSAHDPTEGGLIGGLYELAHPSGTGMVIYEDKIPILPESEILCKQYDLDPLRTITSGSLLLTASPKESEKILRAYKMRGIAAAIIGEIKPKNYGMKISRMTDLIL